MRDYTILRAFELAECLRQRLRPPANEIAVLIYKVTKYFPKDEIYGLTAQMRRSGVSVPSNIVEGCALESQVEYIRFLEIAFGSLRELHYQFTLANRLGYIIESETGECKLKLVETEKVLGALIRTLRKS